MERRNFFKSAVASLAGLFLFRGETVWKTGPLISSMPPAPTVPIPTMVVNGHYLRWNERRGVWTSFGEKQKYISMEVLEGGFTKKMNDNGWHVLLTAGNDFTAYTIPNQVCNNKAIYGTLSSVSYTVNNANNNLEVKATLKEDRDDIEVFHYMNVDVSEGIHVNPGSYVRVMRINDKWTVISVKV